MGSLAWFIVAALYGIGAFGMYVMSCDVNAGPVKSKSTWLYLLFWPLTVVVLGIYEYVEAKMGKRRAFWLGDE